MVWCFKNLYYFYTFFQNEALDLSQSIFGSFVQHKLSQEKRSFSNLSIEFPCNDPESPKTIPNRLLKRLQLYCVNKHLLNPETDGNDMLYSVLTFRPLNHDLAIKVLKEVLEQTIESEALERLYIVLRCLSNLMCPKEFLGMVSNIN